MKFCDDCFNRLVPKGGKLYCKPCDKYYRMTPEESHLKKDIHPGDGLFMDTPIVYKEDKYHNGTLMNQEDDKRNMDLTSEEI